MRRKNATTLNMDAPKSINLFLNRCFAFIGAHRRRQSRNRDSAALSASDTQPLTVAGFLNAPDEPSVADGSPCATRKGGATSHGQRRSQIVVIDGIDLEKPIERNPLPLLDRQWMLGGLELDQGTLSARTRSNLALEIQCVWITQQAVREPAEPW